MTAPARNPKRKPLPSNDELCEAFTRAGQEVAWRNKQLGYPLITWDDEGHVMEVAPEDIPDDWLPPEKRRNGHAG